MGATSVVGEAVVLHPEPERSVPGERALQVFLAAGDPVGLAVAVAVGVDGAVCAGGGSVLARELGGRERCWG